MIGIFFRFTILSVKISNVIENEKIMCYDKIKDDRYETNIFKNG